jgi:mono/diheme cytochrome c family protein
VLLTISLVIAGLSTGQKLGIAAAGAVFIAIALVFSLLVPSRYPNFPGRHMGWFIVVVACLVIGMIAAVFTLGKEKPEASAATTPATTTSPSTSTGAAPPAVQGDPVAGKQVFKTAGCVSCHTLKAAGATGTVGPDLDQLKPAEAIVVHQVTVGGAVMPSFKDTLTAKQIQDVAAFVYTSTH